MWKNGELKSGGIIPWQTQIINTLPDSFLWEKDKTSILILPQGLYSIGFGFYCKKRCNIQMMVNGETVLQVNSDNNKNAVTGVVKIKDQVR